MVQLPRETRPWVGRTDAFLLGHGDPGPGFVPFFLRRFSSLAAAGTEARWSGAGAGHSQDPA